MVLKTTAESHYADSVSTDVSHQFHMKSFTQMELVSSGERLQVAIYRHTVENS